MPLKANQLSPRHIFFLKLFIHGVSLFLLGRAYYLGFTDQLGGDPVKAIIHYTGIGAFNLLLLTLTISPLSRLTRQFRLMGVRRLLGLYCFAWACCHLGNYLYFDLQMDASLIGEELTKRPYIVVGLLAFTILLALAITSIPALVRALGARWRIIHKGVYIALVAVCIHFLWSVKADITEPVIYTVAAVALLMFRRDWGGKATAKGKRSPG